MMLSQKLKNIKVAGKFAPFTLECFRHECELILPTPDNWLEMLGEDPPDVLIVEAACEENGGTWHCKVAQYPDQGKPIAELVFYCKDRSIPTIFWNGERK